MVRCGSKNGHNEGHMFKIDWSTCSKYANYSGLNIQNNGGGEYMTI